MIQDSARLARTGAAAALALGLLAATGCSPRQPAANLPKLQLDPSRTTVSGLSSGAYMATQVHLAFSDHIAGVAALAGGPYGCAEGSLEVALSRCLNPAPDKSPDVSALAESAKARAASGAIAPLSGLEGDRVLVMHGTLDTTVGAVVSAAGAQLYRALGGSVVEEDTSRAMAHTFPTLGAGVACDQSETPYLGKCDFDGAGEILNKLYPGVGVAVADSATGELRSFDQTAYRPDGKDAMLADTGYVYVPKACAAGETCSLHIALHGCQQNAEAIGDAFARDAGFNRWADAMHLVVLYPQTRASYAPLNPKACWDWWGYSGAGYDTRDGVQLRWLANAAAALGAPLR
jgi:poly(3-hydroxybutyrate) depolymerase